MISKKRKNLPRGFQYLLTTRRAIKFLSGLTDLDIIISEEGISWSDGKRSRLMWLEKKWPRTTDSYYFAEAEMTRDEDGWHLFLELKGLRESTIGNDREVILDRWMPEFLKWIEEILCISDLDPTDRRRLDLHFTRRQEDSALIWENKV